jgi:hypothetical protein
VHLRRALGLACAVALATASCGNEPTAGGARLVREQAAATTTTEPVTAPAAEPTTTTAPAPSTTVTSAPPPAPPPTVRAAAATTAVPAPAPTTTAALPRVSLGATSPRPLAGDVGPYAGLGTWVDVYDWSHYKNTTPTVGPDQVDEMAAQGVQTVFLQTAKHDTPDVISEPELLLPIIDRAHARGMKVVAWYLPTLEDLDNDFTRLLASANLDVDGIAVDIESRKVADHGERSARIVELSRRVREALPGRAIGAIVMPPVQLEVVNPAFWPSFPYRELASSYDVWQTMGYWTDRKESSGYRDPYKYTDENIRRLRNNLGDPGARVSPVGGVGAVGNDDVEAFLRAAVENGAIGGSVYDWRTTRADAWPALRKFRSA